MNHVREHKRPGRPPLSSVDVPTQDRILQESARLFMEFGFDGVSMEQVAEACNVTKAVVYYHFSSKANLFTVAVVRMMENIRQRTLEILNRREPLYDRLLTIARIRLAIETPLDFTAVMRGGQDLLTQEQIESMHEAEERLLQTVADAFQASIESGEVRQLDPLLAARVYFGLLTVGKTEQDTGVIAKAAVDKRAAELLDVMWKGVVREK